MQDMLNLESDFWIRDYSSMTTALRDSFFPTFEEWEQYFLITFGNIFSSRPSPILSETSATYINDSVDESENGEIPKQITWILSTGESFKLPMQQSIQESGLARAAYESHSRPGVTTQSITIFLDKGSAETFSFFLHTLQPKAHRDLETLLASMNPSLPIQMNKIHQALIHSLESGKGITRQGNDESNSGTWLILNDIHALPHDPILDLLLSAWELTGYLKANNVRAEVLRRITDCYEDYGREGRVPLYNLKRIWRVEDDSFLVREIVMRCFRGVMGRESFERVRKMGVLPSELVEVLRQNLC